MTPDFDRVGALVRARDKDRYLAALFAPQDARPGLYALYAYHLELARVREAVSDPLPGEIRLQWWRDTLTAGKAAGAGHPVADALRATIERYRLPVAPLVAMSEAWILDLYDDPMPTLNDLEGFAGETRGALIRLASIVLAGGDDPDSATAAGHAGVAQTIAAVLAVLPRHAARGQVYLPTDVLARHGACPEDLLAGRATPALLSAIAEFREHAVFHLECALALLADVRPEARPAFLPALLAEGTLAAVGRRGYDPFRGDIVPSQLRRQFRLWRMARWLRRL